MFTHVEATGQKEHDCAICWGHQQPSPKQEVSADVPAITLMGYKTTWEEIWRVYNEVYQLKIGPEAEPCEVEIAGNIYQEILHSIKECLHCRWGPAQWMEAPGQRSTSTPWQPPWSEFQQRVCETYNNFWDLKEGSCKQALAMAWDVHRWLLAAVALLRDKIERLSCSVSHGWRWSGSQNAAIT